MEGVSFNEETAVPVRSYGPSRSKGLAEKLVAWGMVKTPRQGEIVLLVITGVSIVAAGIIYFASNATTPKPETPMSKNWPR